MPELTKRDAEDIIADIRALQAIQKRNPPTSGVWEAASAELAPLFAEMSRRQNAGLL